MLCAPLCAATSSPLRALRALSSYSLRRRLPFDTAEMNNGLAVDRSAARLSLSTSFVKLGILLTSALGNVLAAPLLDSTANAGIWSARHGHNEPEVPRTPGELLIDCLSIAVSLLAALLGKWPNEAMLTLLTSRLSCWVVAYVLV